MAGGRGRRAVKHRALAGWGMRQQAARGQGHPCKLRPRPASPQSRCLPRNCPPPCKASGSRKGCAFLLFAAPAAQPTAIWLCIVCTSALVCFWMPALPQQLSPPSRSKQQKRGPHLAVHGVHLGAGVLIPQLHHQFMDGLRAGEQRSRRAGRCRMGGAVPRAAGGGRAPRGVLAGRAASLGRPPCRGPVQPASCTATASRQVHPAQQRLPPMRAPSARWRSWRGSPRGARRRR